MSPSISALWKGMHAPMYSHSWSVNTTNEEEEREVTKLRISSSLSCPKEMEKLMLLWLSTPTESILFSVQDFRGLMMHVTSWCCNWDCILPWQHAWEKVWLLKPGLKCWKQLHMCVCLRIDETGIWLTVPGPWAKYKAIACSAKALGKGKNRWLQISCLRSH